MKLINCMKCGTMFTYNMGAQLCPICKKQDEEDFKKVKAYLY